MQLLGWTLTRSTPPKAIVRPRGSQSGETDPSVLERLNQLENTVERLQLDAADRQLSVLTAVEKVMHQLRAREAKRAREDTEVPELEPAAGGRSDYPLVPLGRGNGPASTAHLAARFRR